MSIHYSVFSQININTSPATRKLKIVPPLMKVLENRGVK